MGIKIILTALCLLSFPCIRAKCPDAKSQDASVAYSDRISIEPVCIAALCGYQQRDKDKEDVAGELTDRTTVTEKSKGAILFQNLLSGKVVLEEDWSLYINDVLTPLAVLGVVFGIINLYSGINGICSRLLCTCLCPKWRCCCTCTPAANRPYTQLEGVTPVVTFGITGVAAFVLAIVGMSAGATAFSNAFIRGSCMVDTTRVRIHGFIENLIVPVEALNNDFESVVVEVNANLGTTDGIKNNTAAMVKSFSDFFEVVENGGECTEELLPYAKAAKASVVKAAESLEADLAEVAADVQNNLLDQHSAIKTTTEEAVANAAAMKLVVEGGLTSASVSAIEAANIVATNMGLVASGPFAWVYVVTISASVGIVLIYMCRFYDDLEFGDLKTNISMDGTIHRVNLIGSWGARAIAFGWFAGFICAGVTGMFAAVAMPGAQIFTDSCQALIDFPLKLSTQMESTTETTTTMTTMDSNGTTLSSTSETSSETTSLEGNTTNIDLIGGCWQDMSVYTILGMDTGLAFDSIDFDKSENMTVEMDPEGDMKTCKNKVVENQKKNCDNKEAVFNAFIATQASVDKTEKSILSYQAVLVSIQKDSIQTLTNSSEKIKTAGSCGFLREAWDETYDILCTDGMNAFATLAMCAQLLTVVGFFLGMSLLLVNRRCGGHEPNYILYTCTCM